MRRLLFVAFLLLSPVTAGAVPVVCPGSAGNTGPVSLADFNTLFPDGCFQQDKLFWNFTTTAPADTSLMISFQQLADFERHTVTFIGNFDAATGTFTIGYDAAIFGSSPLRITQVSADVLLPALGTERLEKTVTDMANGIAYPTMVATGGANAVVDLFPGTTWVHIDETFKPNGGAATGIADGIIETEPTTTVPEPGSWLLLAPAAAALLAIRRRRTR